MERDAKLPVQQNRRTSRAVLLIDRAARSGITLGGMGVIVAVLGILAFIVMETVPLLVGGRASLESEFALSAASRDSAAFAVVGVDEYRELAYMFRGATASGAAPVLSLFDPRSGESRGEVPILSLQGSSCTAADRDAKGSILAFGTSDGRVVLGRLSFSAEYVERERQSRAAWEETAVLDLPVGGPILRLAARQSEGRAVIAAVQPGEAQRADRPAAEGAGPTRLHVIRQTVHTSLLGEESRSTDFYDLTASIPDEVTALALTADGGRLFAGTNKGRVFRFTIEEEGDPRLEEVLAASAASAVTSLGILLGDISLLVGTADGQLSTWFGVPDPDVGNRFRPFRRIHEFPRHEAPVAALESSPRNKSFLSLDSRGAIRYQHNTTERILFTLKPPADGVLAACLSPKSDGLLVLTGQGRVRSYRVEAPHPEVSLNALFGKIWYEGYSKPDYVWQSTGGSDEFEGKFSLIPLIFGTLKGTLYALLFAVPVAILAALYTSQFMADRVRQYVKPTVEIMAALPSVVLGFLAGLYLAPRMETLVPAIFLFLVIFPVVLMGGSLLWSRIPRRWASAVPPGFEMLALIPLVLLAIEAARWLGPGAEALLFPEGFRNWLMENAGTRYDQRNSMVVGFAMGFAVIPIIFTISEDSLSAVPRNLISGSLACGASHWQTATRIVLPAAGSGIFSAVMIGFGRAVGETMIVLMATGNTPIMDWSIFNGMRTLSANIAVEMPEAPYRGSLYRILFLAALMLLLMTSLINTSAEIIRLRLKRRFGNY